MRIMRKIDLAFLILCLLQALLTFCALSYLDSRYERLKMLEYQADLVLNENYSLPKSEYNELSQDGKVWAYVRKDGKL